MCEGTLRVFDKEDGPAVQLFLTSGALGTGHRSCHVTGNPDSAD
jgi:hypothetical protein